MADQDRGTDDGPNLELPSFGLGRRKKRKETSPDATAPGEESVPPDTTTHEQPTVPDAGPVGPSAPEPTVEESTTTAAESESSRDVRQGRRPTRTLLARATPRARRAAQEEEPAAPATHGRTRVEDAPADAAPSGSGREKRTPTFTLPPLNGWAAAVVTGLVVGLGLVLLTFLSLRFCELVRNTSTCGGAGLLLLGAILVALVFLGRALLRAWDVPDPLSTSFLAVGLLAVIALLILIDVIFSWTMFIVIPLVSMGTFALSHWVTTRFVEPADH